MSDSKKNTNWDFKISENEKIKEDPSEKFSLKKDNRFNLDYCAVKRQKKMKQNAREEGNLHLRFSKKDDDLQMAPRPLRLISLLFDFLFFITLIIFSGKLSLTYYPQINWAEYNIHPTLKIFSLLVLIICYSVCFAFLQVFSSKTLGKFLTGTRVEHIDGGPLIFASKMAREFIAKPISFLTLIGPLVFLFSNERRSFHDMLTSSCVRGGRKAPEKN